MMSLLLHICCAPCAVACVRRLREEGLEPTGYWYNPNIHPFAEYRARQNCLIEYAQGVGLTLEVEDLYGLRPFVAAVADNPSARCGYCYSLRLEGTARYAAEHGFDSFCTTLTVSPYQNTALIFQAGEKAAQAYGVTFLPYDFSPRYREGQAEARTLGLYMQKYCGCVFSEEERYLGAKRNKQRSSQVSR